MLSLCKIIVGLLFIFLNSLAIADIANGQNPYDTGYGFDMPTEASWGGWTRGGTNTLYAEWDTIVDASYGTSSDRTAAPDVGSYNAADAYLSWNPGLISTSTGNLISPSVAEEFNIYISPIASLTGQLIVALQVETWGLEPNAPLLNGLAAFSWDKTFTGTSVSNNELNQYLGLWYFDNTATDFHFNLTSQPFVSLTQVAVDIARVPEPSTLAVMLIGFFFMGSVVCCRNKLN